MSEGEEDKRRRRRSSQEIQRLVAEFRTSGLLTLLLGGIDLKQTKTRNWYRKTVLEGENIEKDAGN